MPSEHVEIEEEREKSLSFYLYMTSDDIKNIYFAQYLPTLGSLLCTGHRNLLLLKL